MKFSISSRHAIIFLSLVYGAGIIGFLTPYHLEFASLTPLNLLIALFLLLFFQENKSREFWIFFALAYLFTWTVEFIGVQSGLLFGAYAYGSNLGWKLGGTPLLIGANWLLLLIPAGTLLDKTAQPIGVKSMLGALILVGIDALIEPVAIRSDFWSWLENGEIPALNYLGWFVTAFFAFLMYFSFSFSKSNPMAAPILAFQVLFFLILNQML